MWSGNPKRYEPQNFGQISIFHQVWTHFNRNPWASRIIHTIIIHSENWQKNCLKTQISRKVSVKLKVSNRWEWSNVSNAKTGWDIITKFLQAPCNCLFFVLCKFQSNSLMNSIFSWFKSILLHLKARTWVAKSVRQWLAKPEVTSSNPAAKIFDFPHHQKSPTSLTLLLL